MQSNESVRTFYSPARHDRRPDAFGNSVWDREMLAMAKYPFAINPSPQLKEIALANGWMIYQPESKHAGN